VFLTDPGFVPVHEDYGVEAHPVALSEPMPPARMAKFREDFINGHITGFCLKPIDRIDRHVRERRANIVDSAKWAQKALPGVPGRVKPDVIAVGNAILFPAIKRHGVPWVRIISCPQNEIGNEAIPRLSDMAEGDREGHAASRARFNAMSKPIHDGFGAFLSACGEAPGSLGQFFEASPFIDLLLYPSENACRRAKPLDPACFQHLQGCVREDKPCQILHFAKNDDGPLPNIPFGSLGAEDTGLLKRLIALAGRTRYRALVDVGDYRDCHRGIPGNVMVENRFPQPSGSGWRLPRRACRHPTGRKPRRACLPA